MFDVCYKPADVVAKVLKVADRNLCYLRLMILLPIDSFLHCSMQRYSMSFDEMLLPVGFGEAGHSWLQPCSVVGYIGHFFVS